MNNEISCQFILLNKQFMAPKNKSLKPVASEGYNYY